MKQGNILHDLVVASLEEGGVQRRHRHHALFGKPPRHGDGVLLGNADVQYPTNVKEADARTKAILAEKEPAKSQTNTNDNK